MEQSGYISERQNLLLTLTSQYIIYGKGILGQYAGILGNSITEMKAQKCAYLHNVNNIIILIL